MKQFLLTLVLVLTVGFFSSGLAIAQSGTQEACEGAGGTFTGGECVSSGGGSLTDSIKTITNIIIFIVGAASVIMLIIGGLRFVLSAGDSGGVEGARNTILYSVIGIIVAFMAFAIVNFVLGALVG